MNLVNPVVIHRDSLYLYLFSFINFFRKLFFANVHSDSLKMAYSRFESVIKFTLECDDISIEMSSCRRLWIVVSDKSVFCVYFGSFLVCHLKFRTSLNAGSCLEFYLIWLWRKFKWFSCSDLQNIWSMRVKDRFELRVGRVIFVI